MMSAVSAYLWLALVTSGVAFLGFSFTYFGPMLDGAYPPVSPTVHVHGWTFFLWYLLFPLQAGLIATRRVAVHRRLGMASLALAVAMVLTGLVVIGMQMELVRRGEGSPFFEALGPGIFMTLVLFTMFYGLGFRHRRTRSDHKRYMLLASAGGLGAAAFRVLAQVMGFGPAAGIAGVFAPNLIVVAAILIDVRKGDGVHRIYRWGLPLSLALEAGAILLRPTPAGTALSTALAWMGRVLSPLYL